MKRFSVLMTAVSFIALSAVAETDYVALPIIRDIQAGKDNANQIQTLRVNGAANVDSVKANLAGFTGLRIAGLPKDSFTFADDFYTFLKSTNATEATTLLAPWKYTGDGGVAADCTVAATAGGVLKLITGATSNNEAYVQYGASGTEGAFGVTLNGGKKVAFEARVAGPKTSVNAATFVGLSEAGSSAANFLVDSTGILDTNKSYMGFLCGLSSTNTYWNFQIHLADSATTYVCTNVVANAGPATFARLGFTFDGVSTVTVYGNGTARPRTFTIDASDYPSGTAMSPIIGCKSIAASYSPTNNIDYLWVSQDR